MTVDVLQPKEQTVNTCIVSGETSPASNDTTNDASRAEPCSDEASFCSCFSLAMHKVELQQSSEVHVCTCRTNYYNAIALCKFKMLPLLLPPSQVTCLDSQLTANYVL